ncbi:hypothetical protein BsWGS_08552 [Bradybaena similaris]
MSTTVSDFLAKNAHMSMIQFCKHRRIILVTSLQYLIILNVKLLTRDKIYYTMNQHCHCFYGKKGLRITPPAFLQPLRIKARYIQLSALLSRTINTEIPSNLPLLEITLSVLIHEDCENSPSCIFYYM